MNQNAYSDSKEIILYEEKPVIESFAHVDEIKVYDKGKYINWKECFVKYWSFFAVTTAFAAIFLLIYVITNPEAASDSNYVEESFQEIEHEISAAVLPESDDDQTTELDDCNHIPPLFVDESMVGIENENEAYADCSLATLFGAAEGVKVIIIHSHTSEYVSESLSVISVGEVLSQILTSGGIDTYHCKTIHDADGVLGAYSRMNETLLKLRKEYTEAVVVIDIHDSDSGKPLTYTVGTGFEYGWNENLKLACAMSTYTGEIERVIRTLPGELGQSSGILTLNIGICGKEYSDDEARSVLALLAKALMKICENNTPADHNSAGVLFYPINSA